MDSYLLLAFVLWPAIAVVSALINMLIWWTFSWSELAMAYATGVAAGSVAYAAIDDPHSTTVRWLAVCTQGPVGVLKATGSLTNPTTYFLAAAGIVCGSTLLAALLDRAAVAVGTTMSVGGALLSLLIFPLKVLAAPLTGAVGLLML